MLLNQRHVPVVQAIKVSRLDSKRCVGGKQEAGSTNKKGFASANLQTLIVYGS